MSTGRISKYSTAVAADEAAQWKCGIYLRLSREDGDKLESDSISTQKNIVNRFLSRELGLNIYDTYSDDGFSGTNFNRPDFQRMMIDIKLGKVNCIIIKDLSRLGRNYHEMGEYLEVVFPLLKIRLISINDRIDSFKDPKSMRNASVAFKNVMNDEYCRDTSNKVRSALTARRRKGLFIGSFASYGYLKSPEDHHKLIIDYEAAEVVRLIYKSFIEGKSILSISRALSDMGYLNPTKYKESKGLNVNRKCVDNRWDASAVRRILRNEIYIGNMVQKQLETVSYKVQVCRKVAKDKQIKVANTHEAIIDKETFFKVQELLTRDTRTAPKTSQLSIFAGFVRCADCKRSMVKKSIVQPYKTYNYYVCSTYRKQHKCSKHTIDIDNLENVVLTVLHQQIAIAVEMDKAIEVINNSPVRNLATQRLLNAIASKVAEKTKATKFLDDLYPDMKSGLITLEQFRSFQQSYSAKLTEINASLDRLTCELEQEQSGAGSTNDFVTSFKKFRNITTLSREVIVELINMIYVKEGGGIVIEFKFQDAFEKAVEYINVNTQLIAGITKTEELLRGIAAQG